jgi:predicted DNA-binding transcriptional regulator YafY
MKMSAHYRQWLILKMFPPKGIVSTTTLRDRLCNQYGIDTTLRTIQRDLLFLERNGFPLVCDGNNPAGWSWRRDAPVFNIANMDPVTALTFKLAETYLYKMFPRGTLATLEPYFKAANKRIELTSESSLSRWPKKVKVVSRNLQMLPPRIDEDIMEIVYRAVLEGHRFSATYRSADGTVKEKDINPLGMVFVEGQTYLVATQNQDDNPILMLLHRMLDVKPSDIPVTIPEGFDFDEYTNKELKFPIEKDDIELKVLFYDKPDIDRVRETQISEDQIITETNGSWLLQATVSDSYQLRWWLRGYGERVEVLEPKSLRQEFAEIASATAERYAES